MANKNYYKCFKSVLAFESMQHTTNNAIESTFEGAISNIRMLAEISSNKWFCFQNIQKKLTLFAKSS